MNEASILLSQYASVPEIILTASQKYTEKTAFSCLGTTLTYAEVEQLSNDFAAYLQQHTELKPGDRIAVQLPNILQYPVVVYGALKAGLVVVNTNPLYTERELMHQLVDSQASAIITLESNREKVSALQSSTNVNYLFTVAIDSFSQGVEQLPMIEQDESTCIALNNALMQGRNYSYQQVAASHDGLAVLQYTGGTTGVSKGAMLTHGNLVANQKQIIEQIKAVVTPGEEIYIAPLPLYHIYAFNVNLLMFFEQGAHSVLIPNPSDLSSIITELKRWPFTGFSGINTLFVALSHNEEFKALDFSTLKQTTSGGMAVTQKTYEQWKEITGCEISEGYGLSETAPAVTVNPPQAIQFGTIGSVVMGTEIKVVDEQNNELPVGEIGELCVKGPQVMKGYWRRPDETAQVFFDDGWFKTGDMALIQEDGYVKLTDRKKEMIIVSGFNVYPSEVENAASLHPDIIECAAIGIPDIKTGEKVRLYAITKNPQLSADEVRKFCRQYLTAYKIPKEVQFCESLPKSNVGKILRRKLKEEAAA